MSSGPPDQPGMSTSDLGAHHGLDPSSYTAYRLQHSTEQHLHVTTRRCFIGPIPEGWLKSHQKSWVKQHLHMSSYSSKAAAFSAGGNVSRQRRITGLDGPSTTAMYGHSFPQPDDLNEAEDLTNGQLAPETNRSIDRTASRDVNRLTVSTAGGMSTISEASGLEDVKDIHLLKGRISSLEDLGPHIGSEPRRWNTRSSESGRPSSFVTAPEIKAGKHVGTPNEELNNTQEALQIDISGQASPSAPDDQVTPESRTASTIARLSELNGDSAGPGEAANSTSSLLPHGKTYDGSAASPEIRPKDHPLHDEVPEALKDIPNTNSMQSKKINRITSGLVKFNIPDGAAHNEAQKKTKLNRVTQGRSLRQFRRSKSSPGAIVKMEKMLVRIDSTMQQLPDDYDENDSLKTESRMVEKWREFIVVCRESTGEEADFVIQMYKTRVIPAVEQTDVQTRSAHDIPLIRKTTKVNLYSSLDKTVVIWLPWKKGTRIYILRPQSSASSVEWYTFLHSSLGWKRSRSLQVNVPDLSVSLQLDNPFALLESSRYAAQAVAGHDAAMIRRMDAEKAIAGSIIQRCMKMLEDSPEWGSVLDTWLKNEKMGLAWKRYDRLEWVHGANEQKMYGTLAMQRSHDLELRPKQHYPTSVQMLGDKSLEEPPPVEGFLIRLTSQRGREQRLGKMFFKRLYFSTHNQFLCFCRPALALPPPPPTLSMAEGVNSLSPSQIIEKTPLIFAVNPYPIESGKLRWLQEQGAAAKHKHDQYAYNEAERQVNTLLQAEGYINLCNVTHVRHVHRGSTPADQNLEEGSDVDFHFDEEDDATPQDDGSTEQFDDDRTFELVMKNSLVIRLQTFDKVTKKEWMNRLRKIVKYWKVRIAEDLNTLKIIRRSNLKRLQIDEEMESFLGQYAKKWEVRRSEASPQLFNMCGISSCRTITMSGVLYRKPRLRSTFHRCSVILCHGQLLIFEGSLRERTGKEVPHIHHQRQNVIDLKDCYIYSGVVTEGDLLYQNQTFDSNHPGHHALPRVYLEDSWTSSDEDTMTCFVVWQGRKKSFFKASEEREEGGNTRQRLRYVSRLGVPGRSIVFRTRSRAERDHWVLSIGMELERLQQAENVRVVPNKP